MRFGPSGRFDGRGRSYPAREVREAILQRVREEDIQHSEDDFLDSAVGAHSDPMQLTLSRVTVVGFLDLSFEVVSARLIFERCRFTRGLIARRASIRGLELYATEAPEVDLSWSRIDGDLRLVKVSGGAASPASDDQEAARSDDQVAARSADVADTTNDSVHGITLRCFGTAVIGEISMAEAKIAEEDAEALLATQRDPASVEAVPSSGVTWERVFNAVGLASALAAWVAVVGGATMWARLDAIGASALPSLSALGQSWMITAGLQTLLLPMLLGTSAAVLVYFSRSAPVVTARPAGVFNEPEPPQRRQPKGNAGSSPDVRGPFMRSRPVVALWRLQRQDSSRALVPVAFFAIVAASLYVARASALVLITTAAVIAVGILGRVLRGLRGVAVGVLVAFLTAGAVYVVWTWAAQEQVGWAITAAAVCGITVLGLQYAAALTHRPEIFILACVAVAFVGAVLAFVVTVTIGWTAFMAVITAIAVWVGLGALLDKPHGAAALTLFVVIVAWSGALQYVREIGNREPAFPTAAVVLKNAPPASGLLVGRTSDVVLLADTKPEHKVRQVHVLPADQIQGIDIGSKVVINPETKRVKKSATGSDSDDATGSDQGGADGHQPVFKPRIHAPFDATRPISTLDSSVGGTPVRLELLGISRGGRVAYLWMRVVNMDIAPHPVAEMLGLPSGSLDTPYVVPAGSQIAYKVAHGADVCGCSGGLQAARLLPHGELTVFAAYTIPVHTTQVDVTVPGFGNFDNVEVG